jgi:hypothetical protein
MYMTIFIATSKRFYSEAESIVERLKRRNLTVYHPYFDLDAEIIETDPDIKTDVTLRHFPEIDQSEALYALLPEGYIGCSVTIELTYAYAKGKRIIVSEQPEEYAIRAMVSEVCPPDQFVARFD